MTHPHHDIARAYLAAVEAGELPDELLTDDFSAWLQTTGDIDRDGYKGAVRWLASVCKVPIRFEVVAITGEADRVVVEATSQATLVNGERYANSYVFSIRVEDGRIAHIREYYNALETSAKLLPLMA
jgi:ketosteroid isomerase-like protein